MNAFLDTLLEKDLETNSAVAEAGCRKRIETVTHRFTAGTQPDPAWVRGTCPQCGSDLVSNIYHVGGRGYVCLAECWASLTDPPTCEYRKVI